MKKTLFILLIAFISLQVQSQIIKTKLDITGGISAREYLHGGVRYQYTDITQLGFYLGNKIWEQDENIVTYCFDHMIHFGKIAYNSERPVWYARQGYTYSVNKTKKIAPTDNIKAHKYSYINLSLGREFPVNNWLGFNADLGLIWQFRDYREGLESPIDGRSFTYPLVRVQMFVSF